MALRLARASTQYLQITSGLPSGSSDFTITGWVYVTSFHSSNWSCLFSYNPNGAVTEIAFNSSIAPNLELWDGSINTDGDTHVSVTTWYYAGISKSGGTMTFTLYNSNGTVFDTVSDATWPNTGTVTRWELGTYNNGGGDWWDGRLYAFKAWTSVLTSDEILQEMQSISPKKLTNLWGWWPFFPGSAEVVRDYSGNGHHWTAYNTPTSEAELPLSFGMSPYFVEKAGGAASQNVSPSGLSSGESIPNTAYLSYWPFTDAFTGTDNASWATNLWVTEAA